MSFLLGASVSAIVSKAIEAGGGKVLEKGGEKLLDKALDKAVDAASPFLKRMIEHVFGTKEFSDLFSSEERRSAAERRVRELRGWVNGIVLATDELFQSVSSLRLMRQKPEVALAIVNRIEEKQIGFGKALAQANADFPSLLPLTGYMMLQQQSSEELEALLTPEKQRLDEPFMFLTYIPRAVSGRMGYIYRGKQELLAELKSSREAIDGGVVPVETLLALRACERLSLVLRSAFDATQTLLGGKPKIADIPEAVRIVGHFLYEKAFMDRLESESAIDRYCAGEASQLVSQGWSAMGWTKVHPSSGCYEALSDLREISKKLSEIRKQAQKDRGSSALPQR